MSNTSPPEQFVDDYIAEANADMAQSAANANAAVRASLARQTAEALARTAKPDLNGAPTPGAFGSLGAITGRTGGAPFLNND